MCTVSLFAPLLGNQRTATENLMELPHYKLLLPDPCKALAKRLDFSLDFLLNKKSRKKSSRLATLLRESSRVD